MAGTGSERGDPPGDVRLTWSRSERRVPRIVLRPLQAFLQAEAAGGILLLLAALAALIWVNSPWRDSYERLWHTTLTIGVGGWSITEDLKHWVNDALMALFFLVVGLEIKRELLTGELRDRRTAILPAVAALGGMMVPALIYVALNTGRQGGTGWGIPMATDIAFALGVLTLAARNAPATLKPFLLSLAIVDDIGAIIVIAVFYSGGVSWGALGVAFGLCGVIVLFERIHVRSLAVYLILGVGVWLATYESGVHPTIAGVALGLLTPAVPFQRPRAVSDEAHRVADDTLDDPFPPDADAPQWLRLAELSREAVSPLARVEEALHPWTSWVIVPLFALANAGVVLSASSLRSSATSLVVMGIVLGLILGKVVGISLASLIAVKSGVARLPAGVGWRDLVGTATVAGIGFTVSLFIAELAFEQATLVDQAKVGILFASLIAGAAGFALLRSSGGPRGEPAGGRVAERPAALGG